MTAMLAFENVTTIHRTARGEVRSLDRLNLEVKAGEFVVLRGPSGCGKTTLLLTAGGMLRPTAGRVTLDGRDLYALSPRERNRLRAQAIGFVFQMFHLLPYLDVRENILLAARAGEPSVRRPGSSSPLATPPAEAGTTNPGVLTARHAPPAGGLAVHARAEALLRELGLQPRAHHRPSGLSTGERQRTAIARALLNCPQLILADEPTGNLDPENTAEVLRLLEAYREAGGTVLLVTHGAGAEGFANRILEMRAGSLTLIGSSSAAGPA